MEYALGKAREDAIVQGNTYRITVLTERLLRLEYNASGQFYDAPSQFAINRNLEKPEAEIRQDDKFLEIKTKYFTLSYVKEKNFDAGKVVPMANLKVELNGSDRSWYVNHAEAKNLKGLFIAEDGDPKNGQFQKGLYSLDGFASFNDSDSLIYNEQGYLVERQEKYLDIYLFMYGTDIDGAMKDYFKLTGFPPLVPKYVLGNWWNRELPYTSEKILEIADKFEKTEIPLSVIVLDKDWHIRKIGTKVYETGYTFNKELIDDPEELLKTLHEKNIRIGLSINPVDGVGPHEENYANLIQAFQIERQYNSILKIKL